MKLIKRLLFIFLGYVAAVMAVTTAFLAYSMLTSGAEGWNIKDIGFGYVLVGVIAAVYPLPVAVPVIIACEIRKKDSWQLFAVSGIVLGLIMTALFTEVPYQGIDLKMAAMMTGLSVLGTMTFWLIAWHAFSPRPLSYLSQEIE